MNLMDQVSAMQGQQQGPQEEAQEPADNPQEEMQEDGGNAQPLAPELVQQMQDKLTSSIPPEFKEAYTRGVLAAKKVLYSEKTRDMVMQAIQQEAPIDQKLAHNAAGMVLLLDKESKNTMPQQILIPVGAAVVLEGAEMAIAMGAEITQQDVRDAMDQMSALVMMKFGAKENEIMGAIGGQAGAPAAPQGAPQAPQPGMMA